MTDRMRDTIDRELGARRLRLLDQHFFNRRDQAAALMSWGKPHPVIAEDNLPGLLRAHVMGPAAPSPGTARYQTKQGALKVERGHFRLGSYTPDPDGNTRWVCLDFDGPGHSDALENPEAAARQTLANFTAAGIPAYLERSGGGKGYHLWVFFSQPLPAKLARGLARRLVPDNLRLARGGVAVPRSNRGIEIFPKVDRLKKPSQLGNLVWLPWFHAAPEGANLFYHEEGGALAPFEPESFETVSQETVERILSDEDEAEPEEAEVEKFLRPATRQEDSRRPPSSAWREWKEKALALLPLERVYGDLLTGERSGDGWLRCRDPESPSGEQSRSGNVADGSGEALRGTFHSWRTDETLSVFDLLVRRGMASDFRDAARQVAEMTGVPLPRKTRAPIAPAPGKRGLPVIVTNDRQLREVLAEARWVLEQANRRSPFLFALNHRFVRVVESTAGAYVQDVNDQMVHGHLIQLADWVRRTQDGDADVSPSHDLSKDIATTPPADLPRLDAVVTSPVFTSDGRLLATRGYDPVSGLWLWYPAATPLPEVPDAPTAEDVRAALSLLLDDLLVDFPFQTPADRAHALAALLLPFVKPFVRGLCPIHLFEAASIGSGKSLLAKLIHIIATGRRAPMTTMGRDEEETRKKITSLLAAGARLVIIDNVVGGIDSANLAAALTSDIWMDRWLGTHQMPELPNSGIWFFTGNNPDLSLEMVRRCVRVRIETPEERPWEREGFKHDPIEEWTLDHRTELLRAALVLLQAWIRAGCPQADVSMGSFQNWARTMGGILAFLGVPGFLENRKEMYEGADVREQEWREFIPVWWERFRAGPVSTPDLRELAEQQGMLAVCRGTKTEASQAIRLGVELRRLRGRRFGNLRIHKSWDGHGKVNRWALAEVTDDGSPGPAAPPPDGRSAAPDLFHTGRAEPRSPSCNVPGHGQNEASTRGVAGSMGDDGSPTPRVATPCNDKAVRGVAGSAGSHPVASVYARQNTPAEEAPSRALRARRPEKSPQLPALPAAANDSNNLGCGESESHGANSPPTPRIPLPLEEPLPDLAHFDDPDDEEWP